MIDLWNLPEMHDEWCEMEFISGPNAMSPCACENRAQLWRHARLTAPEEACGLVDIHTWDVFPIPNVSSEPERYYMGEELATLRLVLQMREEGRQFAVYHSHIHDLAEPSKADQESGSHPHQIIMSLKARDMVWYTVESGRWSVRNYTREFAP